MIGLALGRRTGTEITWVFDQAVKAHQKRVDAGRPARGTWPGYVRAWLCGGRWCSGRNRTSTYRGVARRGL